MSKRIIRVFPRRTKATPTDSLAYVGVPDMWAEADEIHISATFTWDLEHAEWLKKQWRHVAPTTIGGPATGARGEDFEPGRYLAPGYVITSRGCPNRCWFCSVWRREGEVRELPIRDGHNVLDDNLLACSDDHIRAVFAMLRRQGHRPEFTGGLEAARLRPWMAEELRGLRPRSVFFANDGPGGLDALRATGEMLWSAGFTKASHVVRSYVLCGYRRDTIANAEQRMRETAEAGFFPMAMLYRPENGKTPTADWRRFARRWARPALTASVLAAGDEMPGGKQCEQ